MVENPGSNITLGDVHRAIVRHRWKSLLFFVLAMTAVALLTFLSPEIYRSEGKLFVRLGRESGVLDPTATLGAGPVVAVPPSRENEINSVVQILQSRALIERVVDAIGARVILDQELGASLGPSPGQAGQRTQPAGERFIKATAGAKSRVKTLLFSKKLSERDRAVITLTETLVVDSARKSDVISAIPGTAING